MADPKRADYAHTDGTFLFCFSVGSLSGDGNDVMDGMRWMRWLTPRNSFSSLATSEWTQPATHRKSRLQIGQDRDNFYDNFEVLYDTSLHLESNI